MVGCRTAAISLSRRDVGFAPPGLRRTPLPRHFDHVRSRASPGQFSTGRAFEYILPPDTVTPIDTNLVHQDPAGRCWQSDPD